MARSESGISRSLSYLGRANTRLIHILDGRPDALAKRSRSAAIIPAAVQPIRTFYVCLWVGNGFEMLDRAIIGRGV